MKNNIKYLATVAFASMSLVGCNDLDTQPENDYVTSQEKQEQLPPNPTWPQPEWSASLLPTTNSWPYIPLHTAISDGLRH